MRVLFLHTNFPGQYRHLVRVPSHMPGYEVAFVTMHTEPAPPGVRKHMCRPHREPDPKIHPYIRPMERAVLQGQAAYRGLRALREEGFVPDLICAHTGFGASMFVKDVFPETPVLGYFEWYSDASQGEYGFLAPVSEDQRLQIRAANAPLLLDLIYADAGICPTLWQQRQFPQPFRDQLTVLHDGVDTDYCRPDPGSPLRLPGCDLSRASEIVTYVARGMEPYRGFPEFLRAVALLQRRRPRVHAVIVGADRVAYGAQLPEGDSWKRRMADELDLDPARTHFTGLLPYPDLIRVLQASSAHVYLTVPFVLSWSMLEAMACGCLLVASDTEPVREVVEDGVNGLLVPFSDVAALADQIDRVLRQPERYAALRSAARETVVTRYSLHHLLPQHLALMQRVGARE